MHNNAVGELMTLERETILAYQIEELLEKLRNNQLDPVAVLEAYQVVRYDDGCLAAFKNRMIIGASP